MIYLACRFISNLKYKSEKLCLDLYPIWYDLEQERWVQIECGIRMCFGINTEQVSASCYH